MGADQSRDEAGRNELALMSQARGSSLIEYSQAFLAMMPNVRANRPDTAAQE